MQFPRREVEVLQLAQDVATGIKDHPEVFPTPLVPPEEIEEVIEEYMAAYHSGRFHIARARQTTVRKRAALDKLRDLVKPNLTYARWVGGKHGAGLELVGWGLPRKPRQNELEAPGQAMSPRVAADGPDWVSLVWQPPLDGGAVAAYRIQCRRRLTGDWTDVGSSVELGLTLQKQETGIELEYRVIAMNAAGDGVESAVVRAVL